MIQCRLLEHANYLSESSDIVEMIQFIKADLMDELKQKFLDLRMPRWEILVKILEQDFVKFQAKHLDFLRNLLKDKSYVILAYMTGILPINNTGNILLSVCSMSVP